MSSIEIKNNPGCLVQLIWFIFVGWWASLIWITVGFLLMVTIIGIPLGVGMFNQLPKVMALRQQREMLVTQPNGRTDVIGPDQVNIILRVLYFIFIGWWLSAIWTFIGYLFCLTIIGLPVGLWMIEQTPALLSLHRGYS
jgi:uncharacterized membrane protein YccF (DUF307 family)